MIDSGYIIYALLALILWVFWKRVRGQTLEQLLHEGALEHHRVLEFHQKHPQGGTWGEYKRWLTEDELHTKHQ